jgi:hypothetical protein
MAANMFQKSAAVDASLALMQLARACASQTANKVSLRGPHNREKDALTHEMDWGIALIVRSAADEAP